MTAGHGYDFVINDEFHIEVGGRTKGFTQINSVPEGYLVLDNIDTGAGRRIPLWLFGFLY